MQGSDTRGSELMTTMSRDTAIVQSGGGPSTPDEASECVRCAAAARQSLRIVGQGTWLHGGRPIDAHATLDLSSLTGIVEYEPGDLTLTALAGTPLHAIQRATRPFGQWLSLDAFGSDSGSLGATFATASHGPLSASVGLPRDIALGMGLCDGLGTRFRAGGRVVKNVAGFDLVRLNVGAWGTLGALLEITVRLRPLPEVDRTLLLRPPATLTDAMRAVRHMPGGVLAAEWLNASVARALFLGERDAILVRLGGHERAVNAQERLLRAVGEVSAAPDGTWGALDQVTRKPVVARWSAAASDLGHLIAAIPAGTLAHANVIRGILRLATESFLPAAPHGARVVVETAPAHVWDAIPPAADDRLSRRLRLAFDPLHLLNPGILGHARG